MDATAASTKKRRSGLVCVYRGILLLVGLASLWLNLRKQGQVVRDLDPARQGENRKKFFQKLARRTTRLEEGKTTKQTTDEEIQEKDALFKQLKRQKAQGKAITNEEKEQLFNALKMKTTTRKEEDQRIQRRKEATEDLSSKKRQLSTTKKGQTTIKQKEMGDQNHVSACCMIMDSNHELVEWLAFHYHTLPLRRVIFLTDARSRTSPDPIVQRWKGLLHITVWNETRVWPEGHQKKHFQNENEYYIWQQRLFHSHCMKTLYDEGHQWVQLFDPDEYMTINERVYNQSDPMFGLNLTTASIEIPSPREAGSTLKFVKNATAQIQNHGSQGNLYLEPFETPCIPFSRKQFGNKKLKVELVDPTFPFAQDEGIEPSDLSTWKWRYWGIQKHTIIGKSLIDFGRIAKSEIVKEPNVHRPIGNPEICRKEILWREEGFMPLVMNHYAASLKQMLFRRSDSRNGAQGRVDRYSNERKFARNYEANAHILEWLPGFVESVGKMEALRLLQHAGDPVVVNNGAYKHEPKKKKKTKKQKKLLKEAEAARINK